MQRILFAVRTELADHAGKHNAPGILAAPFDTELFGHWWYEGPRFIEKVMRLMSSEDEIKLIDCAEALDTYSAPRVTISLPEGSWGEGGHHFVWTNHEVAWMWDVIYPLEDRFLKILHSRIWGDIPALSQIMKQAARELLLLESSDWPFVISTQGAIEYSKMRFAEHAEILERLLNIVENFDAAKVLQEADSNFLQEVRGTDRPFPIIDLRWWQKK